jgi:thiamine-monophosphate kinase
LPEEWTEAWLRRFVGGLAADQQAYGVSLLGGDTTRAAGGLSVTITALGRVPKGEVVLRSGAEPGDSIFVSGTVGDGALGLRLRGAKGGGARHLVDRYLHPQPRVALAPVVRAHATAAMDVSDGLVGDLAHICEQSGVGAEIFVPDVPLSPAAAAMLIQDAKLLPVILNGGDDYEILATVPRAAEGAFAEDADASGVSVTRIGTMTKKKGPPVVRDRNGKPLRLTGGSHVHF